MSTSRFQRLLRLPRAERRMLVLALCWLPVAGLGLRTFGLGCIYDWMRRRTFVSEKGEPDGHALSAVLATARMVALASRTLPYRVGCLRSALVLWWLLARRGVVCRLVLGVGKLETGFAAHAWVEWRDLVLNDDQGVRDRFVAIAWPAVDGTGCAAK